jgi:hypothetical protein
VCGGGVKGRGAKGSSEWECVEGGMVGCTSSSCLRLQGLDCTTLSSKLRVKHILCGAIGPRGREGREVC